MLHILPVGPLDDDEGGFLAVALTDRGPVFGRGADVRAAVRALLGGSARKSKGRAKTASSPAALPPWLAADAAALGLDTRPPLSDTIVLATISLLGSQIGASPDGPDAGERVVRLLRALVVFWKAQPWTLQSDFLITSAGVTRIATAHDDGGTRVFAVLREPLDASGRRPSASSFGVMFAPQPQLWVHALQALWEMDRAPLLYSSDRHGGATAFGPSELDLLAASLEAVAALVGGGLREGTGTSGGITARATLRAPAPQRPVVERRHLAAVPTPGAKVGRNDPCPCGSGKKYKKCCGDVAPSPPRPAAEHDLDARLITAMMALAADTWPGALEAALAACPLADDPQTMAAFGRTWVLMHGLTPDGRTFVQAFLDAQRAALSAPLRAWAEAQARAHPSLHEVVEQPEPGVLVLRDLITGARNRVHDVGASASTGVGVALLARVATSDAQALLAGTYSRVMLPSRTAEVLALVTRRLDKAGIPRTARGLQDPAAGRILMEAVHGSFAREDAPTEPVAAGGSALEWVTDRYDVLDAHRLRALIEAQPDLAPADRRDTWRWLGGPVDLTFFRAAEGELTLEKRHLTVTTSSRAHADRMRSNVEGTLGAAVRHVARAHAAPREHQGSRAFEVHALATDLPLDPAGVGREQDRWWLTRPVPALGGITPLEAMKKPAGRKKLEALLRDREVVGASSTLDLRAVLGLAEGGKPMAARDRGPRLPKASEALLDWIAEPLHRGFDDAKDRTTYFARAVATAVELWNATAPGAPAGDAKRVLDVLVARGPWSRPQLERLLARRAMFRDPRILGEHEARWNGGEPQLRVTSMIVKE